EPEARATDRPTDLSVRLAGRVADEHRRGRPGERPGDVGWQERAVAHAAHPRQRRHQRAQHAHPPPEEDGPATFDADILGRTLPALVANLATQAASAQRRPHDATDL